MSRLEEKIYDSLKHKGIYVEIQKKIPLDTCPWKKGRNVTSVSDIYLPKSKTYIEIKGFMTIFAMAKMSWFCKQDIQYYIFQGTEYDWPIYQSDAILRTYNHDVLRNAKSKILSYNIDYQIRELVAIEEQGFFDNTISLTRLQGFIKQRIDEYIAYNKAWY